jgi:glycosyltransferase involved in cell wall biosynthesis
MIMHELPLISIVTPSYNQGRFIEETILSVLNQDYPHIEYIIMDGGSTDQTLNIIRKYQDQLICYSEKDKGQTDAINNGLRIAKGDILAYLNSDDMYLPGAISRVVRYLISENPGSNFVYGEGYKVNAEGTIIERFPTEPFNLSHLAEICYICQPTTFWKREVIEEIGLFDENLHYAMDYDYWIRVAQYYGTLDHINDYLAQARVHPETKTMSRRFDGIKEATNLVKKHYGLGNVPATWTNGYAFHFLEPRFSRKTYPRKLLFDIVVTLFAQVKFFQYNHTISLPELERLIKRIFSLCFQSKSCMKSKLISIPNDDDA